MSDGERESWVQNDEGLHCWFFAWEQHNKGGMKVFIRENRSKIDEIIHYPKRNVIMTT